MTVARFVLAIACIAAMPAQGAAQMRPELRRTVAEETTTARVAPSLSPVRLRAALTPSQRASLTRRGNAIVARLVRRAEANGEPSARERRLVERYVRDVARAAGREPDEVADAAIQLALTRLIENRERAEANLRARHRARVLLREALAVLREAAREGRGATYVRPTLRVLDGEAVVHEERVTVAASQVEDEIADLEGEVESMDEASQLLNIELQNAMQRLSQMIQMLSNMMKQHHDTTQAIIRNMR